MGDKSTRRRATPAEGVEEWRRVLAGQATPVDLRTLAKRLGLTCNALRFAAAQADLPLTLPLPPDHPTARSRAAVAAAVADWRRVLAGELEGTQESVAARHGLHRQSLGRALRAAGLPGSPPSTALDDALEAWRQVLDGSAPAAALDAVAHRHGVAPKTLRAAAAAAGLATTMPRRSRYDVAVEEWRGIVAGTRPAEPLFAFARRLGVDHSHLHTLLKRAGVPTTRPRGTPRCPDAAPVMAPGATLVPPQARA